MKSHKNKIYETELLLFPCDLKMCIITNTTLYCVCELIHQILPVSKSNQMITFYFENGCVATLRTSGTEPKIKYYTELACQPGDKYVDFFDWLIDNVTTNFRRKKICMQCKQMGLHLVICHFWRVSFVSQYIISETCDAFKHQCRTCFTSLRLKISVGYSCCAPVLLNAECFPISSAGKIVSSISLCRTSFTGSCLTEVWKSPMQIRCVSNPGGSEK